MPAPALSTSIARTQTWPYLAHLYSNAWRGNAADNSAAFKRSLGWLTSTPTLKFSVNSTGHPVTLSLPAAPVGSTAPVQGDIVVLTEQGGDGNVVWAGIIEDVPDDYDVSVKHELIAEYVGIDLDGGTFATTYAAATDIGVMMRAAVGVCTHLWADTTSIPNTGLTRIFDFSGGDYTALRALEEGLKMAGQTYYYFIDPTGRVWFGAANMNTATYTVVRGQDYRVRRQRVPITNLRNYVPVIGGIPAGQQNPIAAAYDNGTVTPGYPPAAPVSAPSSQYGLRGVTPALKWSRVVDQTTLNAIAATIGGAVNRVQKKIAVEIVGYSKRISLATATGATMRYWEPASTAGLQESEAGTGYSPILVAIDLEVRGPLQKATLSDMPTSLSDLKTLIDRQLDVVGSAGATAVQSGGGGIIVPGQIPGAVPGGPNTPTVPGFYAQGNVPPGFGPISGSTVGALDLTAQAYLDYVDISFAANPANENVVAYEIRWQKQGDTQWSPPHRFPGTPGATGTITYRARGLVPGVVYNWQIRALNYLNLFSAWSATTTAPSAFVNLTAPAVPTGLSAVKTPRGALVSWTPNTEADLRGYDLQVSIGGGAFSVVAQNMLASSFAYVAPAGTALGTSLAFQVRASNWAANFSAWSASSTAVNTDGIVFDELLAGNLKVFGTLTTGGLQTAASGARVVLDSVSLRIYDSSATNYGAPSGVGVTVELRNDGSAFFKGTVSASKVYASVVTTSAAFDPAPAAGSGSGFRLAGQYLDLYTQGSTPQGVRFWYTPDAVTAWSLVGSLVANGAVYGPNGAQAGLLLANAFGLMVQTSPASYGFIHDNYGGTGAAPLGSYRTNGYRGTPGAPVSLAVGDAAGVFEAWGYDSAPLGGASAGLFPIGQLYIKSQGHGAQAGSSIAMAGSFEFWFSDTSIQRGHLALKIDGAAQDVITPSGALNAPTTFKGTPAPTSWGTVPLKLAEVVLAALAASIAFSSIPATFRNLRASGILRSNSANASADVKVRFNGDSAANYNSHVMGADGVTDLGAVQIVNDTFGQVGIAPVAADLANNFGVFEVQVPLYSGTTALKGYLYRGGFFSAGGGRQRHGDGEWANTAAINAMTFLSSDPVASLIAGSTIVVQVEP